MEYSDHTFPYVSSLYASFASRLSGRDAMSKGVACGAEPASCRGFDLYAEDVALLGFGHINVLGRYALILPDPIARGELRLLHDVTTLDD